MRKLFIPYANNEDADQSMHPRSLISVFVIRCLESIIYIVCVFVVDVLVTIQYLYGF